MGAAPQDTPSPFRRIRGFGGGRAASETIRVVDTVASKRARPWDASYLDGPPPWDIGQPQPAVLRLAREGGFRGAVLDAGCGTGENALHIASLGLPVLGVDVAATAVSLAREKATARGLDTDFVVADALHLDRLGRRFETVLDCGLFHALDDDERRDYVASLAAATSRGGNLYVLFQASFAPQGAPAWLARLERVSSTDR